MQKKFFIGSLVWCSLAPLLSFAQNRKIDSLRAILNAMPAEDVRIDALTSLGAQLKKAGNTDSAILLATQAKQLARSLHNDSALARSYLVLGKCYADRDEYPEALWGYLSALKLYAHLNNVIQVANLSDNVANVYNYQGNYKEAIRYHALSLHLSQVLGDKDGMATTHNNLGSVYQALGNYPEALTHGLASLKIREAQNDREGIARSLTNLGSVYYGQGNYQEALKNFTAALKICKEIGQAYGISLCYNNIGTTYTELGDPGKALENHFAALKIKEGLGDRAGIAVSYNNIGLAYANLHEDAKALQYYSDALAIEEEIGNQDGIALLCNNIGILYLDQRKTVQSRTYLEKGLRNSLAIGTQEHSMASYRHLARLDSLEGNFRPSFINYKKYIAFRDSMNNEENTKKTVQTQMQYEFDKKEDASRLEQERKDALAESDKKRQNIILVSVSGFGLLVLGFAIFAWRSFLQKKKANIEISRQKEIIEEKQTEILDSIHYARRIQSSLMPHEKQVHKELTRLIKNN